MSVFDILPTVVYRPDCGCSCHTDPRVKHVAACCNPADYEEKIDE